VKTRRETITVLSAEVISLVQRGYALALRTEDTALEEMCVSLESAVVAQGLKRIRVHIRRDPHERQIQTLLTATNKEQ
jgi:hypothetical protein